MRHAMPNLVEIGPLGTGSSSVNIGTWNFGSGLWWRDECRSKCKQNVLTGVIPRGDGTHLKFNKTSNDVHRFVDTAAEHIWR